MEYNVDLISVKCLDRRTVEANSPQEAMAKTMDSFHKEDVDDMDYIEISKEPCGCIVLKEGKEIDICNCEEVIE